MVDINIGFKQIMFAIALEAPSNNKIKVSIPDIFLENVSSIKDITHRKGNIALYKNAFPPSLSEHYIVKNYIELPFITPIDGNSITVEKGDKLLVAFPNENPKNGYIIGRC